MTWAQLFDLHTMEHRHLVLAYGLVALVQLGYLGSMLRGLRRARAAEDGAELGRPR